MIVNHPLIGRRVRVREGNRHQLMMGKEHTIREVWAIDGQHLKHLLFGLEIWPGMLFGSWRFDLIQDPSTEGDDHGSPVPPRL